MKKKIAIFITAITLSFSAIGCSGSSAPKASESSSSYDEEYSDYASEPQRAPSAVTAAPGAESDFGGIDATGSSWENINTEVQKIIRDARLDMETKEFQKSLDAIEKAISAHGGYVSESEINGRTNYGQTAYLVARIPADKLDAFLKSAGESADIITQSISSADVSGQYFDSQARKKSLEIQLSRLEAIMAQSAKLEDIIKLETEIARLRYDIESLETNLRRWDNLVAYSTVTISLREIREYETPASVTLSLGQRISLAFSQSLKGTGEFLSDLLVAIIYMLPALIIIALIVFAAFKIWRKVSKAREEKRKKSVIVNTRDSDNEK